MARFRFRTAGHTRTLQRPVNPLLLWILRIAAFIIGLGVIVLAFFFLAAAVVAGTLLAGVVLLRLWWLRRKLGMRRTGADSDIVSTEYRVIHRERQHADTGDEDSRR
jgi:hypothetical protein